MKPKPRYIIVKLPKDKHKKCLKAVILVGEK